MLRVLYIADHRTEDFEVERRNAIEWALNERGTPVFFDELIKENNKLLDKTNNIQYGFVEIVIDEDPKNQTVICEEADKADVIVVDYGGMSMFALGAQGLIDHWNRFFIKTIEDRPSKEWYVASNVDMYDSDDHERLAEIGVKFRW